MNFIPPKTAAILSFLALYFCLLTSVTALPLVSEKIFFLNEDGKHYVRYETTRTDHHSYTIWFKKDNIKQSDQHLKDFLYIYPNNHSWDTTTQPDYDLMQIDSGSYATLVQAELNNTEINISDDGTYTYTNWDGRTLTPDNHYGLWNKPDSFSQMAYAWVFPQNFNIISYKANRKGKWVKRNNTITYYGYNVNDLVFTIKYQPRINPVYRELVKALNEQKQVQLKQESQGVKITLATTLLFSSGSSDLSEKGKLILKRLTRTLSRRNDIKIIIEGHSDNDSINGALAKKYKTNWELSAARSLNVLHYFADHNILESQLEVRAHGSVRPVALNDTDEGRAKNRRIEIMIVNTKNKK
jgi:outer membrane protein OmpA-like peptidoglycan-associated protein